MQLSTFEISTELFRADRQLAQGFFISCHETYLRITQLSIGILACLLELGWGMSLDLLPDFIRNHYEVHEWKHACAILYNDFLEEWTNIVDVLTDFRLKKAYITQGGGNKSLVSAAIDSAFYARGWEERHFSTKVIIDAEEMDSPTHKVDCFKNGIALEVEWNNKDPFFDRDLNNFRLLFDLRAISVGIIVTRCDELQAIFNALGRGKSYGMATTHMGKLLPKIEGGGGGGCPLLVFGIKKALYVEDERIEPKTVELAAEQAEEEENG